MNNTLYIIKQNINRRILYSFNMTLEDYNKLDPEVQTMILQEYWNKQSKEEVKTKKLSINNKRY